MAKYLPYFGAKCRSKTAGEIIGPRWLPKSSPAWAKSTSPPAASKRPPLHLVEELEPGLHDLQVHRVVVDQVHEDLLHAAGPGNAVDEVHVAGRADADGQAPLVQRLGLPADGRVVEPVGRGEVGSVEVFQAVDAGEGQVARLQVAARRELGVLVTLAEVALDAAVGKRLQLRAAVDRFDVAEIVAQDTEQLLQVPQPEVVHEHLVHLGGAFVFHRDAVIAAAIEGTEDALARVHGEVLGKGIRLRSSFSAAPIERAWNRAGRSISRPASLRPPRDTRPVRLSRPGTPAQAFRRLLQPRPARRHTGRCVPRAARLFGRALRQGG